MRISIQLSPLQTTPQPLSQHHIQSAFYDIFREAGLDTVHNESRYKFYCFSNIFPFTKGKPYEKDVQLKILFASVREELLECLKSTFKNKPILTFGGFKFQVQGYSEVHLRKGLEKIKTATPINISIPKEKFVEYGITSTRKYIGWTNNITLNAFIDGLTSNLIKKYNAFYSTNLDVNTIIFRNLKYNGFAAVPFKKGTTPATHWEFNFSNLNELETKLLNFALDTGLGGKNSAGFGFINNI